MMLALVGFAVGKVLDLLFGKAEPFEYTGTTTLEEQR